MTSPRRLARIAGLLYLLLAVLGGWAEIAVRGTVHVPGDAARTTANIAAGEGLFRLGLTADILMATVFVLLGLALYRLLHPIHARAATTLLVFVAVSASAILTNLTFHAGALIVATDPTYGTGREALVLLLLDLHHHGYLLGNVFFGLWLLPLGYLACRSRLFPTTLGVLLLAGCAAFLAEPVLAFALPGTPDAIRTAVSVLTSIPELALILYLLIRGVRV